MSALIRVVVSAESAQLQPGERAELTLTVQNFGEVVDRYRITVEGVPAEWATVSRPELSLFPKDRDQVRISLHPPAGPETRAGRYDLVIQVTSQEKPDERSSVPFSLEVVALGAMQLSLSPSTQRGTAQGTFTVGVHNPGNADLTVLFEAMDPEGGCFYLFDSPQLTVPAGQECSAQLVVRPVAPLPGKEPRSYTFTVTARPAEDPKLTRQVQGEWKQLPRRRFNWLIVAAAGAGVLLVAAAALLLLRFLSQRTPTPSVTLPASTPKVDLSGTATALALAAHPATPAVGPVEATASPLPTGAPTKQPTSTPTPLPTSTPTPAPSPTPTPACVDTHMALAPILPLAQAAGLDLGCATGPSFSTQGALQEFWKDYDDPALRRLSLMIWRSDETSIYVIVGEDQAASQGALLSYSDTWAEGQPEIHPDCAGLAVPTGALMPIRGFGKVWCTNNLVGVAGWPRIREDVATLLLQPTERGLLLQASVSGRTYRIAIHYGTARTVTQIE